MKQRQAYLLAKGTDYILEQYDFTVEPI